MGEMNRLNLLDCYNNQLYIISMVLVGFFALRIMDATRHLVAPIVRMMEALRHCVAVLIPAAVKPLDRWACRIVAGQIILAFAGDLLLSHHQTKWGIFCETMAGFLFTVILVEFLDVWLRGRVFGRPVTLPDMFYRETYEETRYFRGSRRHPRP